MRTPASVPTEEELRAAWARCRTSRHTTWPATFEEAMADPVFAGLLRLNAKHPPRAWRAQRPAANGQASTPTATSRPRARRALPLPGITPSLFDRKRAAAGERDDD